MTERDERLGAAIRALPVPDHAEDFWSDFENMLAAESGQARGRSWVPRFAAVAAAILVVVAGVAVFLGRSTDPTTGVAAGGRTIPPMVSGVLKIRMDDGRTKQADTHRFAQAVDGSWMMELVDGTSGNAFDAATRRDVINQEEGSGNGVIGWIVRSNVEPTAGGMLSLGALESTAARHAGVTGVPTTYLGRAAHRYDRAGELTSLTGSPADHTSTVVDDETGLLLSRTDTRAGMVISAVEVTELTVHDHIDRSVFVVNPPAGARILNHTDGQTQAVELDKLADVVGYNVDAPRHLLGLDLVDVTGRPGKPGANSGAFPSPLDEDRALLVYRLGYDAITVTTHRVGPEDTADVDPLSPGAPVTGTIVSDPAGDIHVVESGPVRELPHAWTTRGHFVVTASGALTGDELLEVIRAIAPSE